MSQHLHHLTELYMQNQREQWPNVPDYARAKKKFSDKTANGLTQCIILFLKLSGHQAERISSMGRVIDNREYKKDTLGRVQVIGSTKYIPGTSRKGTADISSTLLIPNIGVGISAKWEVKVGKDRQRPEQKQYEREVEKAGGVYRIVTSFDDFYEKYQLLMKGEFNNGRLF